MASTNNAANGGTGTTGPDQQATDSTTGPTQQDAQGAPVDRAPDTTSSTDATGDSDNDHLGDAGKRALTQERDRARAAEAARKAAEAQNKELKAAIAKALGVEPDPKAQQDDLVSGLTATVNQLQARVEVADLARDHGITDRGDLQFLLDANADARPALAARLAPKAAPVNTPAPDPNTPGVTPGRVPAPDPSAGSAGAKRPGTVAEAAAAYRARDAANNRPNP